MFIIQWFLNTYKAWNKQTMKAELETHKLRNIIQNIRNKQISHKQHK